MHRITFETLERLFPICLKAFPDVTIAQSERRFFVMMLQHATGAPRCTTTFV
jgi:hypothetical protein